MKRRRSTTCWALAKDEAKDRREGEGSRVGLARGRGGDKNGKHGRLEVAGAMHVFAVPGQEGTWGSPSDMGREAAGVALLGASASGCASPGRATGQARRRSQPPFQLVALARTLADATLI